MFLFAFLIITFFAGLASVADSVLAGALTAGAAAGTADGFVSSAMTGANSNATAAIVIRYFLIVNHLLFNECPTSVCNRLQTEICLKKRLYC